MKMSNVGRIITDFYCGGFFGRDYDFAGSEIVAEDEAWIVIRKPNGLFEFGSFQSFDWNRNEDESLSSGISNLTIRKDRQELIDTWCRGY